MLAASRRSFLSGLIGAVALPAAAGDGDTFWEEVRRQFAFPEEKVPMNAANLCPSPTAVGERVAEVTENIDRDCSFQNRARFEALLEPTREAIAAELGVSADEIALVRNTSEANNTVNNGLHLESGDEIVLWEQNHPTNNVAWEVRAARFGVKVRKVATPAQPGGVEDLLRPFVDAFGPKTKVLALTHVSNVSGVRLPVKELCAAARGRQIYTHVDGAQSWGALDVDLRDIACDSYAASAHKWYVGPKEVGLLYVRADRIDDVWPNVVAPGWGDGPETTLKGARKFESLGQRDDGALMGLGVAAEFHGRLGNQRRERRVLALARQLKEGLAGIGARLVTPAAEELSGGVCILEIPPANRQAVLDRMYTEYGIAGSTSGGFRLCPHIYNTPEHVRRAVEGLDKLRELWA